MIGDQDCQEESVHTVQTCLQQSPTTSFNIMKQIALALSTDDDNLTQIITKMVPQFIKEALDDTNHAPVIEALFANLDNAKLNEESLLALMRYKQATKTSKRNFEFYMRNIPDRQRKLFGVMVKTRENNNNIIGKNRHAKDDLVYGIFLSETVKKLSNKSNVNVRGDGSDYLRHELEEARDVKKLVPHLKGFLSLLNNHTEDTNVRVTNNILDILLILQKRLPINIAGHLKTMIRMMVSINSEDQLETKTLYFENVMHLMTNNQPQLVVDELFSHIDHKNARVREDILNLINMAMLTYPSYDFDIDSNSIIVAEYLTDPQRRVRQACLECLALHASCLGNQRIQLLYDFITHLERKEKTFGEVLSAVKTRIARKCLPRLNSDGIVEYGLVIPAHYEADYNKKTARAKLYDPHLEEPDIHWILGGSGSLSRGSTAGNSGDCGHGSQLGLPRGKTESRLATF